ncbi:MAG: hypothetical protein HeimC2_05040 [Candidatus Heimdallarchaeota archaeon LC_2]|nr:MAG: hypothetical protein HeimC2_05040 [Candidatus Heimdallarchaeota archaeon LC_2]
MTEKNPEVKKEETMVEEVKEAAKDEAKEKTEKKAEETKQGLWAKIKSIFKR